MKKEDFYDTKWDQSEWTEEMKIKWQEKCFELGFEWASYRCKVIRLNREYFFLYSNKYITYEGNYERYKTHPHKPMTWGDMFPEEQKILRQLKPFELRVGMKVIVEGHWSVEDNSVEKVTELYKGDDCGFNLSCGTTVGGTGFKKGDVKVYLVEDVEEEFNSTAKVVQEPVDKESWTDTHYNHHYTLTEKEREQGFVKLDAYKVAKVWKIGSKDDSGCLWHTFKIFPRYGEKNSIEREIKAMYNQIKCLAEIEGVTLDN